MKILTALEVYFEDGVLYAELNGKSVIDYFDPEFVEKLENIVCKEEIEQLIKETK